MKRTAFVLAALVCVGCGSNSPMKVPELVPFQGEVTLDGKPLPSAQVFFVPKGSTKGQGSYASTAEDGKFSLKYTNGADGIPKGDYAVQVSKLLTKDGKPIPEGQTAADVGAVDIIPARYKDPEAPMNTVTITEPKEGYVIALKSK
jgi:hypothetical protein